MAAIQRQRLLVELAPVAAGRLFQVARLRIRNGNPAIDDAHLPQQLIFLHRRRGRIEFLRRLRLLLRRYRCRHRDHKHQRQCADDETSLCEQLRHATSSLCIPCAPLR